MPSDYAVFINYTRDDCFHHAKLRNNRKMFVKKFSLKVSFSSKLNIKVYHALLMFIMSVSFLTVHVYHPIEAFDYSSNLTALKCTKVESKIYKCTCKCSMLLCCLQATQYLKQICRNGTCPYLVYFCYKTSRHTWYYFTVTKLRHCIILFT